MLRHSSPALISGKLKLKQRTTIVHTYVVVKKNQIKNFSRSKLTIGESASGSDSAPNISTRTSISSIELDEL